MGRQRKIQTIIVPPPVSPDHEKHNPQQVEPEIEKTPTQTLDFSGYDSTDSPKQNSIEFEIEPLLDLATFRNYLKERIEFGDIDAIEAQVRVLLDEIQERKREAGLLEQNPKESSIVVEGQSTTTSWSGLLKPKPQKTGMSLAYFPPVVKDGVNIAHIQESSPHKFQDKWKHKVALYVVGKRPLIPHLKKYISIRWPSVNTPSITLAKEGYFLIDFNSIDDVNTVLEEGPSFMGGRPVLVKQWVENFDFRNVILRKIPVWVKFRGLPLHCWGANSLGRIGSILGIPLRADVCTTEQNCSKFARVIEVDGTQEMVSEVSVVDVDGNMFKQSVEYHWKPEFCQVCQEVGHLCPPLAPKQKWQAKETQNVLPPKNPIASEKREEPWITPLKTCRQVGTVVESSDSGVCGVETLQDGSVIATPPPL